MIEQLVESIILGACHELRARPVPWLWFAPADWNRAAAGAVIEYHAERERKAAMMSAVLGSVAVMGAVGFALNRYARELLGATP